jgi:RNA recognition motif-containing protein
VGEREIGRAGSFRDSRRAPAHGRGGRMGKTVYVGNMSREITEDRLRDLFATHGDVTEVRLVTDYYTGESRGFGFVDMATEEAARMAISKVNGQTVDGRPLKVDEARPRRH